MAHVQLLTTCLLRAVGCSYEADYDGAPNADERRALEAQVAEFGQVAPPSRVRSSRVSPRAPCFSLASFRYILSPTHTFALVDALALCGGVHARWQIPLQLFDAPHPPRLAGASRGALLTEAELSSRLQDEEDALSRGQRSRHTRGAGPSKPITGTTDALSGFASGPTEHAASVARDAATVVGLMSSGDARSGDARSSDARSAAFGDATSAGAKRAARASGGAALQEALGRMRLQRRMDKLHAGPVLSVMHAEDGSSVCSTSDNQCGETRSNLRRPPLVYALC